MAMVLAVNWPPQAPGPGQAWSSRSCSSASVLDRDVVPLELARHDRASVEHERREVQARERHDGAGDGLVAAGERHDRVEEVAAGDQLDGIRDDLPADEGGLHALRPHRDAVGDGDRVVFDRRAAGRPDAGLDALGQPAEMEVAGHDLDPGVGDAHERTGEVLVGEAHRLEHGPGGRAAGPVQQIVALVAKIGRHSSAPR
jgi:hypothetical protein